MTHKPDMACSTATQLLPSIGKPDLGWLCCREYAAGVAKILDPDYSILGRRVIDRGDFARGADKGFFQVGSRPHLFLLLIHNRMLTCVVVNLLLHSMSLLLRLLLQVHNSQRHPRH